jgi:hypothetical protein
MLEWAWLWDSTTVLERPSWQVTEGVFPDIDDDKVNP